MYIICIVTLSRARTDMGRLTAAGKAESGTAQCIEASRAERLPLNTCTPCRYTP